MMAGPVALALLAWTLNSQGEAPRQNEALVAISTLTYWSHSRTSTQRYAFEAAYQRRVSHYELGGGLRTAVPQSGIALPLEFFLRARARAVFGRWEPGLGPEIGWSGFAQLRLPTTLPPDWAEEEQRQRMSGFYAGIDASPLRFRVGRWLLGGPALFLGVTLSPPGAAARFQLTLVSAGGAW